MFQVEEVFHIGCWVWEVFILNHLLSWHRRNADSAISFSLLLQFMKKGKLYLLPTTLTEDAPGPISTEALKKMGELDFFIVERARTARRYLKACHPACDLQSIQFFELDKRNPAEGISDMLNPLLEGQDMGLMSEAGCPGVADPGALVVAKAHDLGIQVVPHVGPSSILLALMASGMNGQSFRFNGYLPAKKPELQKALKQLEQYSAKYKQTEIWIEAPYRNGQMIETAVQSLSANTRFCMALNLTDQNELIISKPVKDWGKVKTDPFHKIPAIFLLEA